MGPTDVKPVARRGLWAGAQALAEKAPASRNRYVDFLRAFSILAVVLGHWLVAAPYIQDGAVVGGHLLGIQPWARWLTWGFQVMPIFFLVGGYSNARSWAAAQRDGGNYSDWFSARLRRLVTPVLPLFLLWTLFALTGKGLGVAPGIVKLAAQLALIPVWFLSVYLVIAAAVPLTHALWQRFGIASFWGLAGAAAFVDLATYGLGVGTLHYTNFAFVWFAVHQLGYAWSDGHFSTPGRAALWGVGGFATLCLLVGFGPFPVAMIGVPGEPVSNSMPPTVAMLALGVCQTGLLLALEPAGRAWLENLRAWTAVVFVSALIMTVYLWHLTAFIMVMVVAWGFGGIGLGVVPGSGAWWLARPLWLALYFVMLVPFIAIFARFERPQPGSQDGAPKSWRLILGLALACCGFGLTAALGIGSDGQTGVRIWLVMMPFIGAAIAGFGPIVTIGRQLQAMFRPR